MCIRDRASIDVCIVDMFSKRTKKVLLGEITNGEVNIITETDPDILLKQNVITISEINDIRQIIIKKIESNSKVLEGNYASVKDGVKLYERGKGIPPQPLDKEEFNLFKNSKPFTSNKKLDDTYKKFYIGRNIDRYMSLWSNICLLYTSRCV